MAAMVIETKTETLTTMPLEEFPAWLRHNNMEIVSIVPNTWPPQLICRPKAKAEKRPDSGHP